MNKHIKIGLAAATLISMISTSVISADAVSTNTDKEEVIYITLDENGKCINGYAVNIFDDERDIVDYGNYSKVKNMNTDDKISYHNQKVTISTDEERLYYEGYLKEIEIPWDINISYYLDGKKIAANKLAKKSGHLEIKVEIKENKECDESFFKSFALQSTFSFDTNRCSNIKTAEATIANVGANKQLTYTMLPNKSKTINIEMDVVDFIMDAPSFNGIKIDLGLDSSLIDESGLSEKVNIIKDSVSSLNNGAIKLSDGSKQLADGSSSLDEGIKQTQTALNTLSNYSSELTDGSGMVSETLDEIQSALDSVAMDNAKLKLLISSSAKISGGIEDIYAGLNLFKAGISTYETELALASGNQIKTIEQANELTNQTINQLNALINSGTLDAQTIAAYQNIILLLEMGSGSEQLLSSLKVQLNENNENTLMNGVYLLNNNYKQFDANITELVNQLQSLSTNLVKLKTAITSLNIEYKKLDNGIITYASGVNILNDSYDQIVEGSKQLVSGSSGLYNGTISLSNGTSLFTSEVNNIDIESIMNDMIKEMTGSDIETKSFTSSKNTKVKSVQFVITGQKIKEEKKVIQTKEKKETSSLIDKISDLFDF